MVLKFRADLNTDGLTLMGLKLTADLNTDGFKVENRLEHLWFQS